MKKPTIYIGADHAGFDFKTSAREHLESRGFHVEDLGAHELDPTDDYPIYGEAVADAVRNHPGSLGVLSCGNAEGICIAANKFDDIRAGVGYAIEAARTMRTDDNANIVCIPGRVKTDDDPLAILDAFLDTEFSQASRHINRIQQVEDIEERKDERVEIIPTVLVDSEEAFLRRITYKPIREIAPVWQVDILDGTLFNASSWADPRIVASASSLPAIELHLMIQDPLSTVTRWRHFIPTLKRAIIHAEIDQDIEKVVHAVKSLGIEVGVALSPDSPLNKIDDVADDLDVLLIMGVHPGKSGQVFLGSKITEKIYHAKQKYPNLKIEIDGGVKQENAALLVKSGARRLSVGSAIWGEKEPKEAFQNLYNVVSSQLK